MGLYYDDILNNDDNTFSIYLYNHEDSGGKNTPRINSTSNIKLNTDSVELIRGVLVEDPVLDIEAQWGTAANLLTDIGATAETVLSSIGINFRNLYNTGVNALKSFNSDAVVKEWNQTAIYNLNEYTKTFKGLSTNLPLSKSFNVYPYLKKESQNITYKTVQSQLKDMLDKMYSKIGINSDKSSSELVNDILTSIKKSTEGSSNEKVKVIEFSPPHSYTGIPNSFLEGQWMSGTIAIRSGNRWLYNLLLRKLQIQTSKWSVTYNGTSSVQYASVTLDFVPAVMITPKEQIEYIYKDNSGEPDASS